MVPKGSLNNIQALIQIMAADTAETNWKFKVTPDREVTPDRGDLKILASIDGGE